MKRSTFLKAAALTPFAAKAALAAKFKSDDRLTEQQWHIDADTANEIDDLYAITRALIEPGFNIIGLSSAQWFNWYNSTQNSVHESQELNEKLLAFLGREDIPHPLGAELKVGRPWGGDQPVDSDAAQFIIERAKAMPAGERLNVITLGAMTNLASAIVLAPEIVPNIKHYALGANYYQDTKIWNKSEFNIMMDYNAANVVWNTEGLDHTLLPTSVAYKMKLYEEKSFPKLEGYGGVWDFLADRWKKKTHKKGHWIMWDLALIEAIIHPELAKWGKVMTPPENKQREINMILDIDNEAMTAEWWRAVEAYRAKEKSNE